MKRARLIAGVTAAIPAAAGGFAAPAAAHAAQATTASAQQRPGNGKTVQHYGIQLATTGPQWAPLSESEILYYRSGGTQWLRDGTRVFVTCYYHGAPGQDPWWDHITSKWSPGALHPVPATGHVADRHVDFGGAHHYYPFSVGIGPC
jgi:hypothetical protein